MTSREANQKIDDLLVSDQGKVESAALEQIAEKRASGEALGLSDNYRYLRNRTWVDLRAEEPRAKSPEEEPVQVVVENKDQAKEEGRVLKVREKLEQQMGAPKDQVNVHDATRDKLGLPRQYQTVHEMLRERVGARNQEDELKSEPEQEPAPEPEQQLKKERQHFGTRRIKISPISYESIGADAPIDLDNQQALQARKAVGFVKRDPNEALRVENSPKYGLVARYKKADSQKEQVSILSGSPTKPEKEAMNIFEKQRAGVALSEAQRDRYLNDPKVTRRVDSDMERQERDNAIDIARRILDRRELTSRQESLLEDINLSKRVRRMVREGRLETDPKPEDMDMKKFPEIFDKIEEGYRKAPEEPEQKDHEGAALEEDPTGKKANNIEDSHVGKIFAKMNLDRERLLQEAPEFFALSENQQIYVLEKLRQKINLDADFEAKERVEQKLATRKPFFKNPKAWFAKKWSAFMKDSEIAKAKREIIAEKRADGLRENEIDLRMLARHVRGLNLPFEYKDGKLLVNYVAPESGISSPYFIQKFNEAATAISEMPHEWSTNRATLSERKRYKKALKTYEIRKQIMLEAAHRNLAKEQKSWGRGGDAALAWMNGIDAQVHLGRLLTTHPELDALEDGSGKFNLANINSKEFSWLGKSSAFVGGFMTRVITRHTWGIEGGLVLAGGLGGMSALQRKWAEYSDKEKKQKYGFEVKEKEGLRKVIDAEKSIARLKLLLESLDTAADKSSRRRIVESIKGRVLVVSERLKEDRVNLGPKKRWLLNKLELTQLINESNARLFAMGEFADTQRGKELFGRFQKFQNDTLLKWEKRLELVEASLWGAIKSAAFLGAGYELAANLPDWWHKLTDYWSGASNEVPPEVVPVEGTPPHIPDSTPAPIHENPINSAKNVTESIRKPLGASHTVAETVPAQEAMSNIEALKNEIVEKLNADGTINHLVIQHPSNFTVVKELRQAVRSLNDKESWMKYLTGRIDQLDIPSAHQNESWLRGMLINTRHELEDFVAWKEYLDKGVYAGDSVHLALIKEHLRKEGEDISRKLGPIFAPYESIKDSLK